MTKTRHKRTAVASMFQMVFLKIPNVPKGMVFTEQVTFVMSMNQYEVSLVNSYTMGTSDLPDIYLKPEGRRP